MAVSVSGKNYTQISSCDTISSGGTWSAGSQDTANKKEGVASLSNVMKSSGLNSWTFTPTSSVDLSGTTHLRVWFLDSAAGLLANQSAGGIQLGVSDGSNTGYWYLGGKDTYSGGWVNLVVNCASSVQNGTKPTSMNAITSIIVRINQTSAGKNFDNVWVDNLNKCDGLIAYGDDSGGYFDFDDIYAADDATTLGIGIIRKIGGVYYLVGSLDIGDSAGSNSCKFQAKSQIAVFEDRPVSTSLYGFNIIDNGTGTTEFILGAKSGSAGIQGCTIRVASNTQSAKFFIDGLTDTDVDNFKLYGSVFYGAGAISFPAAAANVEILNCSFEECAQVIPGSAGVSGCFFINTSDADAALLWNESIDISSCSFIGNTNGAGIEMPGYAGSPYAYDALLFSGNTYDVYNSSGSAISVNKNNGSNPTTYEGSSVTFLGVSVTTQITCKNVTNLALIENARVLLEAADADGPLNYQESVSIVRSGSTATVTHTGHGLATDAWVHIRGCNEPEYNIVAQITYISDNSYSYSVSGTPDSPATGSPTSTTVIFNHLTNSSGIVTDSRSFASHQNVVGRARKSTSQPLFKSQPISEQINKDTGLTLNVLMIPDE